MDDGPREREAPMQPAGESPDDVVVAPSRQLSLDDIPDEVIQHILYYVSPEDSLHTVQRLSHRLGRIANGRLLWRHYCRHSFSHWNPEHEIYAKLAMNPLDVDWKALFLLRKRRNAQIATLFDGILASRVGRCRKFEQICRLGYDAKDFLEDQCLSVPSSQDVLARRYYGGALIESIYRGMAINEWQSLLPLSFAQARNSDTELASTDPGQLPHVADYRIVERAIGAFDLFVQRHDTKHPYEIPEIFDRLVARFRAAYPGFDAMTIRNKALSLNHWLRANELTGLRDPDARYRDLGNCFLGAALRSPGHPSLPIISCIIYCSVAGRLGLLASPCLFPAHVHLVVLAPAGQTIDDDPQDPAGEAGDHGGSSTSMGDHMQERQTRMYLDPWGNKDEVTVASLNTALARYFWLRPVEVNLRPAHEIDIILRVARNVGVSVAFNRRTRRREEANPDVDWIGDDELTLFASGSLASLWAIAILTQNHIGDPEAEGLGTLLERIMQDFPQDMWLVERFLQSETDTLEHLPQSQMDLMPPWSAARTLAYLHKLDTTPPTTMVRGPGRQYLRYHVGQVFRHKRYNLVGLICGWIDHNTCGLPHRRYQTTHATAAREPEDNVFYYAISQSDQSRQIVSHASVELITDPDEVPPALIHLAGRDFLRFDRASCTFESNILEEYPEG